MSTNCATTLLPVHMYGCVMNKKRVYIINLSCQSNTTLYNRDLRV